MLKSCPHVKVDFFGRSIYALLDTGASRSFYPSSLIEYIRPHVEEVVHGFYAVNHTTFQSSGRATLDLVFPGFPARFKHKFFIADFPVAILGADFLHIFGLDCRFSTHVLSMPRAGIIAPFIHELDIIPVPKNADQLFTLVRISGDMNQYQLSPTNYPHWTKLVNTPPREFVSMDNRLKDAPQHSLMVTSSTEPTLRPGTLISTTVPILKGSCFLKDPLPFPLPLPASITPVEPPVVEVEEHDAPNKAFMQRLVNAKPGDVTILRANFSNLNNSNNSSSADTRVSSKANIPSISNNAQNIAPVALSNSTTLTTSSGGSQPARGAHNDAGILSHQHPSHSRVQGELGPDENSVDPFPALEDEDVDVEDGQALCYSFGLLRALLHSQDCGVQEEVSFSPLVRSVRWEIGANDLFGLVDYFDVQIGELVPPGFADLCRKYKVIFSNKLDITPIHDIQHTIRLSGMPRKVNMYSIPMKYHEPVREKIIQMRNDGILERSTSAFASPLTVQVKKNGDIRPCVDFRALNEVVVPDVYALPRMDMLVAKIEGAVFSSIDLKDGFHQIPLDPESKPLTAIYTPFGNFQFTRLPFGLKTAPAGFQRFIDTVLGDIDHLAVYIDDILVYTPDVHSHMEILRQVFERLEKFGLRINLKKSIFFTESTTFLGFDFDAQGHRPTETAMPKITGLKPPRTRKQLQSFLGVVNFYREHIPNFSLIADPLHKLLSVEQKFHWGPDQQASFETLRKALMQRHPLAQPRDGVPFHLYSDASQVGMGCVLLQEGRVVGYYARRYGPTQRRYSVFEQEALAIILALKHYRYLLMGQEVHVWTDHKPLVHWFSNPMGPQLPLRQVKWLVAVQDIPLTVHYIPGPENYFADLLSRPHATSCSYESQHLDPTRGDFIDPRRCPELADTKRSTDEQLALSSSIIKAVTSSPHLTWGTPLATDLPEPYHSMIASRSFDHNVPFSDQFAVLDEARDAIFEENVFATAMVLPLDDLRKAQLEERVDQWRLGARMPVDTQNDLFGVITNGQFRILVPQVLRHRLIAHVHSLGHPGGRLMRQRLAQMYFWPNMRHDIDDYVKTCLQCAQAKPSSTAHRAPLLFLPTDRFRCLHIDIVGRLPPSGSGRQFVVTMLDRATRWLEAVPTHSITTTAVSKILINNWITRFGIPDVIISDQGTQFEADLFQAISIHFGISKRRTTAYHPQTNGRVERSHRTMKQIIRALKDRFPDWEQALPVALYAMRTSVMDNGFSPAQLIYMEPLTVPGDLVVPPFKNPVRVTDHQYLNQVQSNLRVIRDMMTTELRNQDPEAYPASHVYIKQQLAHGFDNKYKGPYKVLEDQYPVLLVEIDGKPTRVNVDNCKPYFALPPFDHSKRAPGWDDPADSDESPDFPPPSVVASPQSVLKSATPQGSSLPDTGSSPHVTLEAHDPSTIRMENPTVVLQRLPDALFPSENSSVQPSVTQSPLQGLPSPTFHGFEFETGNEQHFNDFEFDQDRLPPLRENEDREPRTPIQRYSLRPQVKRPNWYGYEGPRSSLGNFATAMGAPFFSTTGQTYNMDPSFFSSSSSSSSSTLNSTRL